MIGLINISFHKPTDLCSSVFEIETSKSAGARVEGSGIEKVEAQSETNKRRSSRLAGITTIPGSLQTPTEGR